MNKLSALQLLFCFASAASKITLVTERKVNAGPYNLLTVQHQTLVPNDEGLPPHYYSGPVTGYVIHGKYLFQAGTETPVVLQQGAYFKIPLGTLQVWGANAMNSSTTQVLYTLYSVQGQDILSFEDDHVRVPYTKAISRVKRDTFDLTDYTVISAVGSQDYNHDNPPTGSTIRLSPTFNYLIFGFYLSSSLKFWH